MSETTADIVLELAAGSAAKAEAFLAALRRRLAAERECAVLEQDLDDLMHSYAVATERLEAQGGATLFTNEQAEQMRDSARRRDHALAEAERVAEEDAAFVAQWVTKLKGR